MNANRQAQTLRTLVYSILIYFSLIVQLFFQHDDLSLMVRLWQHCGPTAYGGPRARDRRVHLSEREEEDSWSVVSSSWNQPALSRINVSMWVNVQLLVQERVWTRHPPITSLTRYPNRQHFCGYVHVCSTRDVHLFLGPHATRIFGFFTRLRRTVN